MFGGIGADTVLVPPKKKVCPDLYRHAGSAVQNRASLMVTGGVLV